MTRDFWRLSRRRQTAALTTPSPWPSAARPGSADPVRGACSATGAWSSCVACTRTPCSTTPTWVRSRWTLWARRYGARVERMRNSSVGMWSTSSACGSSAERSTGRQIPGASLLSPNCNWASGPTPIPHSTSTSVRLGLTPRWKTGFSVAPEADRGPAPANAQVLLADAARTACTWRLMGVASLAKGDRRVCWVWLLRSCWWLCLASTTSSTGRSPHRPAQ
mmetsp:Transcript_35122/g.84837  ORF Transcript_35122/g.84837 Transcript_35122/m.84837 type:complete len:221 (+) Transcript_35122:805-1467(+)